MTYSINENGETILENYNEAKPFSSFFPGIAGLFGIPMWVFFVNRGQCISSFGVESKDKAILEFYPANKSYRFTPLTGFRTFLKITTDDKTFFYEPFQNCLENTRFQCENRMTFSPVFLKLEEFNPILSVKVTVTYITIPNEPFPALARKIEIENTGKQPISIEMIDGIPAINAFGLESWIQKFMCRTGEAWVEVQNLENCAPLYKVKVVIADKPEVEYVHRGHFSLYFDEQGKLLQPIVDPQAVFGQNTGICFPEKWFSVTPYEVPTFQTKENFTPCAMTLYSSTLDQRETRTVCGIFGHVKNLESLNRIAGAFASGKIQNHSRSMTPMAWFEDKLNQNIRLIRELQNNMTTFSASHLFDHYCSMTYLDNVLRGGIPVIPSGTDSSDHLFHVYSRKHGDLERDYNYFYVQPTYLSQGNGNFRDVNQNRRNDIWFNPSMLEANIRTFYNLIQLDGYNPLVLKGAVFILKKFTDKLESELISCLQKSQDWVKLKKMLEKPFAPGQLLSATIMDEDIAFKVSPEKFLSILLPHTKRIDTADFGEGYWSDHWTYNLDQVESYLTLFPEKKEELLFQNKTFTFHQGYVQVNPRKTRYILRNGNPFQTQNLREDHDKMKKHSNTDAVARTEYGKGDVYHACLYSKMLCLVACKMATLDPNGSGIEMEGGRPNWYDALNGLPGLFGSSTHETLELKRLVMFMLGACKEKLFTSVRVPKELAVFIRTVAKLLKKNLKNTENDPFLFWDESNTAKEKYRNAIRDGIHGEEKEFSCSFIKNFLKTCLLKLDQGIQSAIDRESGIIHSYFMNEMTEYETREENGNTYVIPKKFKQKPLPPFLEGQVHYLKTNPENARIQYEKVKSSPLFDWKLGMYKVCASLSVMPKEIGRCTVFSPGWLENESIWLHMEYKYLLEVLRSGLVQEFYEDFNKVLIPFQNPEIYGRSVLENSSFIVSSANQNPNLHGNGFVARLSGSTAEFIHLWLLMNLGSRPFYQEKGELHFHPEPILENKLFHEKGSQAEWFYRGQIEKMHLPEHHYAFVFLSSTLIVYVNKKGLNTFGEKRVRAKKMILTDAKNRISEIDGGVLKGETALNLRNREYKTVIIELN